MTSIAIDRTDGLSSSTAIKGPVRCATTANIALTGLLTVDGVTLEDGDRVLVKDQTNQTENGIYVADSGPWRRAKDFDNNRDLRKGALVVVTDGTDNAFTDWVMSTTNPIDIGTSNITFTQWNIRDGIISRSKLGEALSSAIHISVKEYGAVGNGIADDTAEVQAAINAVEALGGGVVFFPAGTYLVSSTLTIDSTGVYLVGAGMFTSKLYRASDYGDTVTFTGNDATGVVLSDVGVVDLGFQSAALTTSGAHIKMNGVARARISGIYMLRGFYGFDFAGLTAANVSDIYLVFDNIFGGSAASRRYMLFRSAAATYGHPSCGDVFISDFNVRGNIANTVTGAGIEIRSADGLWFDNGHCGNTTTANLLINAADASHHIGLVFFNGVMFDESTGTGVTFQGSSAIGRNIQFSNCNFKGGGTATVGVATDAAATFNNVMFSNTFVTEYNNAGVSLASASLKNWVFSGCQVRGNSFTVAGANNGYEISACAGVQIIGGKSGGSNVDPGAATQAAGINIGAGAVDVIIADIDLENNVTTPLAINAAALSQVSVSNIRTGEANTVASASSITLPIGKKFINITGTTTINTIAASYAEREITLFFASAVTISDNVGNLRLGGVFNATSGSSLTLICNGIDWIEQGRMTN